MRIRWEPLTWGVGAALGALVAVLLGPYVPGWGVTFAVPAATLLFALAVWVNPADALAAAIVRATAALTVGFLATTVPLTLLWAAASPQNTLELRLTLATETEADARRQLTIMWAVLPSALPFAALALHRRRRSLPS